MPIHWINQLPVELIHNIFSYLSAHEIFYAFANLTDYLDNVLASYRYLLDFRSVLKAHFDVACTHLRPSRVVSLILSDDNDTPNQSKLFFSLFDVEQFVELRYFDISSINSETCEKLSNLHRLKNLSALELPRLFQPYCLKFTVTLQQLLPRLNRLMAYNTYYLQNSLPHLRHLTLKHCYSYELITLFKCVPNLHSLDITLVIGSQTDWLHTVPVLTQLKKLTLNIYGEQLTMIYLKQILSKVPHLTHLEFEAKGSFDLVNAEEWQSLVTHLTVFDFRIELPSFDNDLNRRLLEPFRSPFWIEQKNWIVAYDDSHTRQIFTVPHFASHVTIYPKRNWPPACTSSEFYFDSYIRCLYVSALDSIPPRFTNITSLVFDTDEMTTVTGASAFIRFVDQMKSLHSITLRDLSVLHHLPDHIVLDQIRHLYVRHIDERLESSELIHIDRLCNVFPRLERLNMELISREQLLQLIERLNFLSIVNVEFLVLVSLRHTKVRSSLVTREWLIKHSRRLKKNSNFTFNFMNNTVHLWINHEKPSKEFVNGKATKRKRLTRMSCCVL